jgi:hypothetical protein
VCVCVCGQKRGLRGEGYWDRGTEERYVMLSHTCRLAEVHHINGILSQIFLFEGQLTVKFNLRLQR